MTDNSYGKKDCRCICGDPTINEDIHDFHPMADQAASDTATRKSDVPWSVTTNPRHSTPCELRPDGEECKKYNILNHVQRGQNHWTDWTKHVHLEYLHSKNHYFDYLDNLNDSTDMGVCKSKHSACVDTCDNKKKAVYSGFACKNPSVFGTADCERHYQNCKDSCVTCKLEAKGESRVQCLYRSATAPVIDNNPNCGGSTVAPLCLDGHVGTKPAEDSHCVAPDEQNNPTPAPTARPTAAVGNTDGWGTKRGDVDLWGNKVEITSYPTHEPTVFPTSQPTDTPTWKRTQGELNANNRRFENNNQGRITEGESSGHNN